ncbi:hypothetical protein GS458_1560 [Geobacillus stearothermophilus]|nr:hypothetical protein GS458_1560 [Geobacillus stearothermophilus]
MSPFLFSCQFMSVNLLIYSYVVFAFYYTQTAMSMARNDSCKNGQPTYLQGRLDH